jgi:hypothetical protein
MTDLDDNTIIELTDVVHKEPELSNEEEIIELTDIVEDENNNRNLDIVKEEEFELEINDSDNVELMEDALDDVDDVDDSEEESDITGFDEKDELVDGIGLDFELDVDVDGGGVSQTDNIVEEDSLEPGSIEPDDFESETVEDIEFTNDDVQEVIQDEPQLEFEAETKPVGEPEIIVSDNLQVDQEQIETILERIIEKKFADKIESILFEVMENVIEKQIVEIKESLQKDLEQIGNN